MAFFDDNRDTLAAELFSKKPLAPRTTDPTPSTQGLRQKFIKLERLRKQELARWWDITTLKRYLEIKQVPRGLRVIIFPSFEDLDPDLLGEWEHLISSTSFSMINILIKHLDRKRTKLLLDITSLEEEIKNLNLPEATDKNYTIMREILTGYQLYIKDKKMRKLVRDDNDYKNGRIYTFARKFDQVNKESNTRPTNIYTPAEAITGSLSDISNISSDCSDPPREGSSTNMTPHNTTQQSNSFLEELGRYRKGLRQNYNRSGTNIDPPAGGGRKHRNKHQGGHDNTFHHENSEAMSILSLQPTPSICEETVQVMNLSSLQLSMHEINVLKKGLGFCPSSKPDYTNIHIDLFKFIRNLKLKKFFHNKPDTNKNAHTAPPTCNQTIGDIQDIHTVLSLDNTSSPTPSFDELLVQLNVIPNLDVNSGLKTISMFVPTLPPDNHIDVFYQAVSTELYNLEDKRSTRTHRPSNNLNSEELRALHKLSICPDISLIPQEQMLIKKGFVLTKFVRLEPVTDAEVVQSSESVSSLHAVSLHAAKVRENKVKARVN
ncbi:hypothetical protein NDU88_009694 [Pleurodeles waltl]|uniref:Uncharacterized protein n=1 Tax=Pleurodeles waltl TaxID=8319 RepID=A0AAV7QTQ6_PLEWA|nr:hypothetical protein NDU88_009694 [Pleurodeles waltl]